MGDPRKRRHPLQLAVEEGLVSLSWAFFAQWDSFVGGSPVQRWNPTHKLRKVLFLLCFLGRDSFIVLPPTKSVYRSFVLQGKPLRLTIVPGSDVKIQIVGRWHCLVSTLVLQGKPPAELDEVQDLRLDHEDKNRGGTIKSCFSFAKGIFT